jgi:Uma2 family endonuclease
MATTTTREQEQWDEIVNDPLLQDLPYKIETNARGQMVLSPHTARHSELQEAVQDLLRRHAPDRRQPPEYPIATSKGVKQADVIWASRERLREMRETGDPPTRAPEICVEILSASNTVEELAEKRALYREVGAEEVWIVNPDGRIRFFRDAEQEKSDLAPDAPAHLPRAA